MKHSILIVCLLFACSVAFCQGKTGSKKINPERDTVGTNKGITKRTFSPLHEPVVYTFIGNGNWSDPNNWDVNGVPPSQTNPDSKIYIMNAPGGMCYMDVPYIVKSGTLPTWLIVFSGSNLVIPDSLIVK